MCSRGAWTFELSVYVHLNPLRIAAFRLSRPPRKAQAAGLGRETAGKRQVSPPP